MRRQIQNQQSEISNQQLDYDLNLSKSSNIIAQERLNSVDPTQRRHQSVSDRRSRDARALRNPFGYPRRRIYFDRRTGGLRPIAVIIDSVYARQAFER